MSGARLSSENLHGTTVALDGRAVLISGPSGSGKSDLALRLFDRGFVLVSDDRTIVRKEGSRLFASAPETIKGKLEVRGVGAAIPLINVDAMTASAPSKVAVALDRLGLKF